MKVTATQSVNTGNGMICRVMVLTGAAGVGPNVGSSITAYNCSITTTVTGSRVYGTINADNGTDASATEPGTTLIDNLNDTVNGNFYESFRQAVTGTPGATTVGSTTAFSAFQGATAIEVIPAGRSTIVEHSSGPAVAFSNGTASTVTTATFSPPPGSFLVALVDTNGAGGAITMTVSSDTKLKWTENVKITVVGGTQIYSGCWTARVPGGPVTEPDGQDDLQANMAAIGQGIATSSYRVG